MDNLVIKQLKNNDNVPWDLLLLADPSKELIQEYLPTSKIYVALLNNETVGVYILTQLSPNVIELKNVAVDEKYQHQGIGKKLVLDAINKAKISRVKRIEVGTGNSSLSQLGLYQKCGFRIVGVEKDFFIKRYKQEIIENGIRCTDMIRLAIDF